MYEREGGDASIATAIEEHYKPQGPSDTVPTDPVAIAVALADKLDTLVGFWTIDEKPTGSKDPFALRRAALGVVRIILENDVRLPFASLFSELSGWADNLVGLMSLDGITSDKFDSYPEDSPWNIVPVHSSNIEETFFQSSMMLELWEFILDRLKVYLRDKNIRHDIIDAVFANGQDDLVSIVNRVTALQSFLETPDGENLLAGNKRAANILKAEAKKGDLPKGEASRPSDAAGGALFDALKLAKPAITEAVDKEDYSKALTSLASLRIPIDTFFTDTQIIADDISVKENNLRLLGMISDTSRQIADFEAIQG